MTLMTCFAPLFGRPLSNFRLALLPVRQERTKPAAWAAHPYRAARLLRSRRPGRRTEHGDQDGDIEAGGSISQSDDLAYGVGNASSSPPFGSTAIIASLPLLASFRARAEPVVLIRKTIRIIGRNPSASRPLPSKTDRDTNLEGFFWRCL